MAGPLQPHILIFEPDWRGHTLEWLEHIIDACREQPQPIRLSLAVAPELARAFSGMVLENGSLKLNVFPLTPAETRYCLHRIVSVSGIARWRAMARYLARSGADHGVFLTIDHASLPLALNMPLGKKSVSGILFRPSQHYRYLGHYHPNWRERFRNFYKDVLYWRMLINPSVSAVMTLDPYFQRYANDRFCHSEKIGTIADPANPALPDDPDTSELVRQLPDDGRTVFLLFGDLTERKGILVLFEALKRLCRSTAKSAAVLIAGRIDDSIHRQVSDNLAELAATRPELWVHLEARRLTPGEIAALVTRSDVVLAPYQKFVGSSGILMWAAHTGKPVISQDYGLLGQLTRDNGLGLAVDTTDPDVLAQTIQHVVEIGADTLTDAARSSAFARTRTPERFARTLIGAALAGNTGRRRSGQAARPSAATPK